jgi:hypothetical protein
MGECAPLVADRVEDLADDYLLRDFRERPKHVAAPRAFERVEAERAAHEPRPVEPRGGCDKLAAEQPVQVLDADHVERMRLEPLWGHGGLAHVRLDGQRRAEIGDG